MGITFGPSSSPCGVDYLWLGVAISGFKKRTEQRRLKRMLDRQVDTVCFACREKGHAAKDCPGAGRESGEGHKNVKTVVGMCYRFVFSFPCRPSLHDEQMWFDETYVVSLQETRRSSRSLPFCFVFRLLREGSPRFSLSAKQREGYISQRRKL